MSIPRKSYQHPLISARTMDWSVKLPTSIDFVPRGQAFPEIRESGEMEWENKLAFIGAGLKSLKPGWDTLYYWDGLNEAGLSIASLFLGCSEYPEPPSSTTLLSNINVVAYVLGNFKNLKEVETGLTKLTIIKNTSFEDSYHYIIRDLSGNHLIVEFINGKMRTYKTPLGVLTNDPPYKWHLENLSLYEHLTLEDKCNAICGFEIAGSGQLGIPGDPTPQSRFVRAAFLQQTAFLPKNLQQSIGVARQILQTLSVPVGTVYLRKYEGFYNWTQWSVLRDHTNLSYYFYTDFNSNLYGTHFHKLDLNAPNKVKFNITQSDWYQDITNIKKF
ncbi:MULTISPECIES: linear amide C-N hydrolase [Clostridia]|uniref:linear amide C-N hydrolase n=1 Tax=Clostridia TaxID=186801 RepID=UPI000EA2043F|nr:linear amide C-N hydrolase [Clostridium sp. 1xD42-85]NBJ67942.1 linear amide C-N hydrolase [Roseburia sp. 1XD42-34]RKI82389.1 linear amide C-N hydrolase [Clostridium sp. 1xD42-85]